MSSLVRSGKSAKISSSLIPPAKYSSTSYTVMRVLLMHGFPLPTPGVTVMRSCQSIWGRVYVHRIPKAKARIVRSRTAPSNTYKASPCQVGKQVPLTAALSAILPR